MEVKISGITSHISNELVTIESMSFISLYKSIVEMDQWLWMNDLCLRSTILSRLDIIEFQENGELSKNFRSSGRKDWYVFCRLSDEKRRNGNYRGKGVETKRAVIRAIERITWDLFIFSRRNPT